MRQVNGATARDDPVPPVVANIGRVTRWHDGHVSGDGQWAGDWLVAGQIDNITGA